MRRILKSQKLYMKDFTGKKNILWDFDGVLISSQSVREEGFIKVLAGYPEREIRELLDYHRENGGLSRYVKFRYFFENIRQEAISEKKVLEMASHFSEIMRQKLVDQEVIIEDSHRFVRENCRSYVMHIISGSDQEELRFLCEKLQLTKYFRTIEGSPTPKIQLVTNLMNKFNYRPSETILIGDSINDYEAAARNNVEFYGYNNPSLKEKRANYITSFN